MTPSKHKKPQKSHQLKTRQLSRRQYEVIWEMCHARTITETAGATGVNRRTIHRWLHDDQFREAIAMARAENTLELRSRLHNLVFASLGGLLDATDDPNPAIRVRAARVGLASVRHFAEWDQIQEALRNSPEIIPPGASRSPIDLPPDFLSLLRAPQSPPLAIPPPPGVD